MVRLFNALSAAAPHHNWSVCCTFNVQAVKLNAFTTLSPQMRIQLTDPLHLLGNSQSTTAVTAAR